MLGDVGVLCITAQEKRESSRGSRTRQPITHCACFINIHIYIARVNNTKVCSLHMMNVTLQARVGERYQGYLMGFLNLAIVSVPARQTFLILCFNVANEFISSAPHRHSSGQVQVE